jgi:hypothetical protein
MTATIHTPYKDQLESALERMMLPPRFPHHEVMVDGRLIPNLECRRDGDTITFLLDRRFALDVPIDLAIPVASFVANAMAIGAGYPWHGAESKSAPFAMKCMEASVSTEPGVPI